MPSDWNSHYYTCECGTTYHGSTGCDCEQCEGKECENRVLDSDLCDECEDNHYQMTRESNDKITINNNEEETNN